jgi:hypothetical protein
MHWTLGRRRRQHESPVEAARRTANATRKASAVALVAAVLALGGSVGAEILDRESSSPGSCTALALTGYMYLYDDGTITHDEYELLRSDAIEDELNDTGDCSVPAGSKL